MGLAALFLVAALTLDRGLALQDRAQFPPEEQPFIYYGSTEHLQTEEERRDAVTGYTLAMAQASPQDIAEYLVPTAVSPTLYRWDLRRLKIAEKTWRKLVRQDPYKLAETPLVSRLDWLTLQISDTRENPTAYYEIVFSGVIPPNRDKALDALGVDRNPDRRRGLVAGQSGVSVQGVRLLEELPLSFGSAWGTRDVLELVPHKDPAENLERDFAYDGEEWIINLRKIHLGTGFQGAMPIYLLFNSQGLPVNEAPIKLVRDHTEFRGLPEIATPGSCIQCHRNGLNFPVENQLRVQLDAGIERFATPEEQEKIQRFHLADVVTGMKRSNEDFSGIVKLITGVSSTEAVSCFHDTIARYDEPVTLERAAQELYVTPEQLRQTLALESTAGGSLTARIAGLAHGLTISRDAFEEGWLALWTATQKWRPHAALTKPR